MKGSYQLAGVQETFSCGSGPDGWRYVGTRPDGDRLDLVVDDAGRCVRLLAEQDGWQLRGGSVGDEVLWMRGEQEHRAVAAGFTGSSPGYDLATARLLGLAVGQTARIRLVELTEPVGAALTVLQEWTRTGAAEPDLSRYQVADLATGDRTVLHLTAGLLVSREGSCPAFLRTLTR